MRLLVTGFPAFLNVRRNPSEILVRKLQAEGWSPFADCQTEYAILPMDYDETRKIIQGFFTDNPPDVIVHLGLAVSSSAIRLEKFAKNLVFPKDPAQRIKPEDAAKGDCGDVAADGAARLKATLPLAKIKEALLQHDIPCIISEDAGTYLCNFSSYVTAHEIRQRGCHTLSGFIHIPFTTAEQYILQYCAMEKSAPYLMTPEMLEEGIKTALAVCATEVQALA
jgi:pyroglutamyl-peptidase